MRYPKIIMINISNCFQMPYNSYVRYMGNGFQSFKKKIWSSKTKNMLENIRTWKLMTSMNFEGICNTNNILTRDQLHKNRLLWFSCMSMYIFILKIQYSKLSLKCAMYSLNITFRISLVLFHRKFLILSVIQESWRYQQIPCSIGIVVLWWNTQFT